MACCYTRRAATCSNRQPLLDPDNPLLRTKGIEMTLRERLPHDTR
jgi:hypothetical protein